MDQEKFTDYWAEKHKVYPKDILNYGCPITIELDKEEAHDFLSMRINKPCALEPLDHEEGESFLDYTAKEVAIRITFDLEEREGWNLFKGLEEPLSSRVFHYLTKLRSID